MGDEKCPFCGEPRTRSSVTGDTFRCGTHGPDINSEYDTGRVCDMHTYQRLLKENAAEIERLTQRLEKAEARCDGLDIERAIREPYVADVEDRLAQAEARYVQLKAINDDNTKSFLDEMCKHTETLEKLSQAEALLREACEVWKETHMYSHETSLKLIPVSKTWFERAQAAGGVS